MPQLRADVLLVGNLIPWWQDVKYGCMNWAWALCCDFQLFLFVPLWVWLHHKSKRVSCIMQVFMFLFGITVLCGIAAAYNL